MYSTDVMNGFLIALNGSIGALIASVFVSTVAYIGHETSIKSKTHWPLLKGIIFIFLIAASNLIFHQAQFIHTRFNSCDAYHGCLPGVKLPTKEYVFSGFFLTLFTFLPPYILGSIIGIRKRK